MSPPPPQHPSEPKPSFDSAVSLYRKGHLVEARQSAQQLLEREPRHFEALQLLGIIAAQTNDFAASIDLLNKAIAENPTSALAYYNRGFALDNLDRLEDALASYDHALQLDPRFATAYCAKG